MAGEPHDTDGIGCWCVPELYVPCPECPSRDPSEPRFGAGCWYCAARSRLPGIVPAPGPLAADEISVVIVVHHNVMPEGQGE